MWPYTEPETLDIVNRIARDIGLKGSPAAQFLARGSNNEVFLVGTGSEKVAIRVTGHWRALKTHRKKWCYQVAESLGIPGPRVIAVGQIEQLPYIAMSYLSGVSGTEVSEGLNRVWQILGRYAALINGFELGAGPICDAGMVLYGEGATVWRDQLDSCLERTFWDQLASNPIIDSRMHREIRLAVESATGSHFHFGLSHGDLDPRNVIIGESSTISLIDWCCSTVGPVPHVDLYNILREVAHDSDSMAAYLEGYDMSQASFQDLLPQVRNYGLVQKLLDVKWAIAERPNLVSSRSEELAKYVSAYLITS